VHRKPPLASPRVRHPKAPSLRAQWQPPRCANISVCTMRTTRPQERPPAPSCSRGPHTRTADPAGHTSSPLGPGPPQTVAPSFPIPEQRLGTRPGWLLREADKCSGNFTRFYPAPAPARSQRKPNTARDSDKVTQLKSLGKRLYLPSLGDCSWHGRGQPASHTGSPAKTKHRWLGNKDGIRILEGRSLCEGNPRRGAIVTHGVPCLHLSPAGVQSFSCGHQACGQSVWKCTVSIKHTLDFDVTVKKSNMKYFINSNSSLVFYIDSMSE
jgi:hypothetical protein